VVIAMLTLALCAWLWPIGLGGMMPIGGDVTNFFLGLMAVLGEALRDRRLAVWNDLWGYGFPGLAESQMGVYYPPHILLYGRLSTERAYVASFVLHTFWGGWGAYWAARTLGISRLGALLAAFCWSACGFFVIHEAHPWGYTTGSWLPWAWGLTWRIVAPAPGRSSRALEPLLLSLVLTLQMLPGHFQLAFMTQVGVAMILAWAIGEALFRRWFPLAGALEAQSSSIEIGRRCGLVILAVAAAIPLAALQLWPTARLAGLAEGQRDFEYLSGFASTPFHLVNYVAPGLFHRSPLWRPLVWDPFHTSPEEHLAYIGLVPLALAVGAMIFEGRRDFSARLLAGLALATLFLSFGPYAPGFRALIKLPGFSFFRAPSRWSLATAFALAMLAGKGFDRWREWPRPGWLVTGLVVVSVGWIAVTLGLVELGLASDASPGMPGVARLYQRAMNLMPWTGDPSFEALMTIARTPRPDPHVPAGLPPSVLLRKSPKDASFSGRRGMIYAAELWETVALLLCLIVIAVMHQRGQLSFDRTRIAFLALTLVDLWILGRHRLIAVAQLRPLTEQSPLLERLSHEPRGTRIADDGLRNLPMLIGLSPIAAYRTLNLPALESVSALARGPISDPRYTALVEAAIRATGTGVVVGDPVRNRVDRMLGHKSPARETITDPALATWQFDSSWAAEQGAWIENFTVWKAREHPARAWLLPSWGLTNPPVLEEWSGDPNEVLGVMVLARPLEAVSRVPGEWTILLDERHERGSVIVSQLYDPQWQARWVGLEGQGVRDRRVLAAFAKRGEPGGWQRVNVPGSGAWKLELTYEAHDAAQGMAISIISGLCWITTALAAGFRWAFDRAMATTQDLTEA
jgi:hypothetical protein